MPGAWESEGQRSKVTAGESCSRSGDAGTVGKSQEKTDPYQGDLRSAVSARSRDLRRTLGVLSFCGDAGTAVLAMVVQG